MNLLKPTLLLVACSMGIACMSQEPVATKSLSLTVAPTLMVLPTKRIGAEGAVQYAWGQWSVGAQLALPFEKWHDDFARVRYARLGAELLRYKRDALWLRPYVGFRINYTIRQMADTNGGTYASKNPAGLFQYAGASVASPIFAAALKGGFEVSLGKRVFLDYSTGAGIRIITTTYTNVERAAPDQMLRENFPPSYKYEGRYTKFHLSGGLRLGYRLWRRSK